MFNKPDNVVISILNSLYPDIQFIADNGDGVHLKTVFGIVGEVSNKSIGTMRKALRSSTGQWFHAQPKEYLLNIGVQGSRKSNAYDIAEELQFLLNTGRYKALFKQKGFSIRVDHKDIDSIPIQMDTSWFVRYQFPIYLTTDVVMMIDNISIDGVDINESIGGENVDIDFLYFSDGVQDQTSFTGSFVDTYLEPTTITESIRANGE